MSSFDELAPKPRTRFYRVKCPGCGSEQTIFSAASSRVRCVACNTELAKTGASGIKLKTKVLKEFT